MNYKGKKVALSGHAGFIGSKLLRALQDAGAEVTILYGDVRDPKTFAVLNYEYDYLFHFADPSSQVLFKRQPLYAAEVTIKGFLNAVRACKGNGIKLIYPSTGLLSQDKENEYARAKKICEDIHLGENLDAIGLRIFATYGPGEGHKRDYASVPYLFARDVYYGISPEIWGDGEQTRDFIYIDDVVNAILLIAELASEQIIDIGSGDPVSFNHVYKTIVASQKDISGSYYPEPTYKKIDNKYITETKADTTIMKKYYGPILDIEDGIFKLVKGIHDEKSHSNNND